MKFPEPVTSEVTQDQLSAVAATAIFTGRVNRVIAAARVTSAKLVVVVDGVTQEIDIGQDFMIWPERSPTQRDSGIWTWSVKEEFRR